MCFSAQASFAASALLTIIGGLTLEHVICTKQYKKIGLGIIPLFFAIQQLCEGFVWIGLSNPDEPAYTTPMIYAFLFFAFFVWPLIIPASLIPLEKNALRKNVLFLTVGIGATVSITLAWLTYLYGITSTISCSHIAYAINLPNGPQNLGCVMYGLATIVPFFISSMRKAWILGILLLLSILSTMIMYTFYFTSVWCFFAAILSLGLYFFI